MSAQDKRQISLAVIGNVDAGKTMVVGYDFIYRTMSIAERERGCTQIARLYCCESMKYKLRLFDTPGHPDFIKNFIAGISQTDSAIMVISAEDMFEFTISKIQSQLLLAYTFGIRQIMIAISKMDVKQINFSETKFNNIKIEVIKLLKKIGYNPDQIAFVPISAYSDDNMIEKSLNMPWYTGPTLLEAIDNLVPPKININKPFRMILYDVFKIGGIGTVPIGRVVSGSIKYGQYVTFSPWKKPNGSRVYNIGVMYKGGSAEARSIESWHHTITTAVAGDLVGINVKLVDKKTLKRGFVCGNAKDDPPAETEMFTAQIIVIEHPGIKVGYCPVVAVHSAFVSCQIVEISVKLDKRTGKELEENPSSVKTGESAIVKLVPCKPLCVESYNDYPALGRFAMIDSKKVVAVGLVKQVIKKQDV